MKAWNTDMQAAPRDRVLNVVGRYPEASAGFPRYAIWHEDEQCWMEHSRHAPERIIVWAWRERDDWPREHEA